MLSIGNPGLLQQYTQSVSARFGFPVSGANSISLNGTASSTMHPFASSVFTATKDSVLPGGYLMREGSQLTRPVNLSGGYTARAFATFAVPLTKIESNFNINAGYSYASSPSLVNNILGYTNTSNINTGLVLSGHTKAHFDYTLNYTPDYSIVRNTLVPQQDNNYFTEVISSRLTYTILKGFVVNTDFNYRIYSGINSAYSQNYALWNASIGRKFFKKQNGEFRLYVYDILNQQNSLSHTVTDLYVQDRQVNVLGRYFMFSFVYHLRNYRK